MSVPMRAKLVISNVEQHFNETVDGEKEVSCESISFRAVCKEDGYGEDGADENNTYAKFSPTFDARLTLCNPALFNKYKAVDTFYVDFTPVKTAQADQAA